MIFLSIFICFYLFFFRRQRRNFLYRTHVELKKLTLSALFYGKRGKLNHSVSFVFSLIVEREYKTIVVWLVPVDGVLG